MSYTTKTVTMQSGATGTGNGTLIVVEDRAFLGMQVEGISGDTVTFEATIDESTWYSLQVMNVKTGDVSTTATADGLFVASVAGLHQVRARVSTYSAGTITITGHVTTLSAALSLANVGAVGVSSPVVSSYTSAVVNLAASTADQTLVSAGGANTQIWVYGLFMMADTAAGTVTLQDEDDTALSGTMAVSDEGGWVLPPSGNFAMPWIKVATNKDLEADTGACTVDGIIAYAIVDVS